MKNQQSDWQKRVKEEEKKMGYKKPGEPYRPSNNYSQGRAQAQTSATPEKIDYSKEGIIDLLDKKAPQKAKELVNQGLTKTQLRRFFSEVKFLERKYNKKADENAFQEIRPQLLMLKSKVNYALGRKGNVIPAYFRDFLVNSIDSIDNDHKNFEVFCKYFESVVGYCYGEGMKD